MGKLSGSEIDFGLENQNICISTQNASSSMSFAINGIACSGPDLFVSMRIRTEENPYYPDMPRLCHVTISPDNFPHDAKPQKIMTWVCREWFEAGFYFRWLDS
jgi:hypothetical protein